MLGLGLCALGWLLLASRGYLPDILTPALADALLLAGLCLQLAAVFLLVLRDRAARYGGEEFCAVLPGTGMPKALEIANRIRSTVADRPLAGMPRAITVSIGAVVCDPKVPFTLDAVIACADEALYRAKKQGRDQVVGVSLDPVRPAQRFDAGQIVRNCVPAYVVMKGD